MPFIEGILKYNSLSIVGLEKNTGKTECLNYTLKRLQNYPCSVAVTSIGIDGETVDQVYKTQKPEVTIYDGDIFVTSEKLYRQKRITAKIIDILNYASTAMGRLVVAKAINTGKVMLSGPPDTHNLKRLLNEIKNKYNCDLTIVDGALSRLSLGAPAVTDAMILATGAAVSINIQELVNKTKFVFNMISLPQADESLCEKLKDLPNGLYAIDTDNEIHDLHVKSALMLNSTTSDIFRYGHTIYTPGIISDSLINKLKTQKNTESFTLIAKDFTRLFAAPETISTFMRKGGKISVVEKSNLIAITINPFSPSGYYLNSDKMRDALSNAINIPVYDIKRIQ